MLFGARDQLTGVKPSSSEGKLVINSTALSQHFRSESGGKIGQLVGPVKIQVDPQADIYWAYKQAYSTTYNKWRNDGRSHEVANQYARRAGMEFAIARKGASQLPGSKEGLDPALKQVEVAGSPSSPSTLPDDTKKGPSEFVKNFMVLGDPAKDSPRLKSENTEKNSTVKIEGDLAKPVLGKKNEPEKTASGMSMPGSTSLASIPPQNKPKLEIPKPPSTKPTITTLPIPTKSSVPQNTGVSNQSGKSVPGFSSYRQEEPTLAVVASIYNMWGGL
jgi:hypothetical protein